MIDSAEPVCVCVCVCVCVHVCTHVCVLALQVHCQIVT